MPFVFVVTNGSNTWPSTSAGRLPSSRTEGLDVVRLTSFCTLTRRRSGVFRPLLPLRSSRD